MTAKKIALLGSTGSIGRSTLDVIKAHPGQFDIWALAAHSNVELLIKQYRAFRPQYLCIINPDSAAALKERVKDEPVEVLVGRDEMVHLAGLAEVDIVVNAVVGAAGLLASLEAVKKGKRLALANKESLVTGGPLFPPLVEKTKALILPIDSEHSAIWQALGNSREEEVRRIIITASGGPFRKFSLDQLREVTVKQALNHPTWKMGPKITVDSSTLANKGLEVIEAVVLFSMPTEKLKVVIHPQSTIHSMVEFVDSSIMAQLSAPDMRLPISYALFWPKRVASNFGALNLDSLSELTFEQPDFDRFPALKLAYNVAAAAGTAPAIFNAANEVAVDAFLNKGIKFLQIAELIEDAVETIEGVSRPTLENILNADRMARQHVEKMIGKPTCS